MLETLSNRLKPSGGVKDTRTYSINETSFERLNYVTIVNSNIR